MSQQLLWEPSDTQCFYIYSMFTLTHTYTVSVVSGCLMLLLCVAFLLPSCCLPVASLVVPVCLTTTVDAANSQFHTMAHPGAANPDTGRAHRAAMWDRAAMCFGEFMRTMYSQCQNYRTEPGVQKYAKIPYLRTPPDPDSARIRIRSIIKFPRSIIKFLRSIIKFPRSIISGTSMIFTAYLYIYNL